MQEETKSNPFQMWLDDVDNLTYAHFGLSYNDLPDRLFSRDAFDNGCTPQDFVVNEVSYLVEDEMADMEMFQDLCDLLGAA